MEGSDPIAMWALAISALSFGAALWSSYVSHKALTHASESYAQDKLLAFEREKSELLEVLNQNRALFDRTCVDIGTTRTGFEAEPDEVKQAMQPFTDLFTELLPCVEGERRQASMLWGEVFAWSGKSGMYALVHHQAGYRALLTKDQSACELAQNRHRSFKEKLVLVRRTHATSNCWLNNA